MRIQGPKNRSTVDITKYILFTYIPRAPQCLSPRLNSDSPTSSPASECAPPPGTKGEGHTRLRVRGWGSPDSDELRKSLARCPLRGIHIYIYFFWGGGEGGLRLVILIPHRRCSIVVLEGVTGTYFMLPVPYLGQIHRF